jgi:gamma-glutamyltranspeptidase
LSTDPAYVSLPARALLSEVACAAPGVEIVLDDANDPRRRNASDVTRYDGTGSHSIIDDEHRQIVTTRSVYPDQLAVFQEPF